MTKHTSANNSRKKKRKLDLNLPVTATEILMKRIEELRLYKKNYRIHNDRQISQLMASMSEFGFTNPLLVDEGNQVLAGHGRLEAAKRLKYKRVPVLVIRGLTKNQKKAYVIADNEIAANAGRNKEILASELKLLVEDNYNAELTGLSSAQIDILLDDNLHLKEKTSDPDDVQEGDFCKRENVVSKVGDVWILGRHRLYCGNALKKRSYRILMKGKLAQMIFGDPPYNVPVDGHVRTKSGHGDFVMASGEMGKAEFIIFLGRVFRRISENSEDGSIHFICMDWRHIGEIVLASEPVFGSLKQLVIWNKDNGGMGSFYRNKHELIFVFKKGKAKHINNFGMGETGRYRTNVWDYAGVNTLKRNRQEELDMHPTVKPVTMVADAIRDCSKRNGIIMDPFCGSGTTIIAAERTGRIAFTMELDPLYVDTAINRWQRVTGKKAVHEKTGLFFDQMQKKRSKMRRK